MKNERLIALRVREDLTQDQLADKVGLTQSMIARIEAGKREPGKQYKIALAVLFSVTVEWLFYEQINDQGSLTGVSSI